MSRSCTATRNAGGRLTGSVQCGLARTLGEEWCLCCKACFGNLLDERSVLLGSDRLIANHLDLLGHVGQRLPSALHTATIAPPSCCGRTLSPGLQGGRRIMAIPQLPKLEPWVRFPSPAPIFKARDCGLLHFRRRIVLAVIGLLGLLCKLWAGRSYVFRMKKFTNRCLANNTFLAIVSPIPPSKLARG